MCNNNCYLNTPTSQTERQQPDSSVPLAGEAGQENTLSLSPATETHCCGCVTEQAVDGPGVVEVDEVWEWESQHVQHNAVEQSEELTSDSRRSFLQVWWKFFKGSTF